MKSEWTVGIFYDDHDVPLPYAYNEKDENLSGKEIAIRLTQLEAENEMLTTMVGFFASCIKSGEPWTDTCQEHMDALKEKP